jgi:hypothetical protein
MLEIFLLLALGGVTLLLSIYVAIRIFIGRDN